MIDDKKFVLKLHLKEAINKLFSEEILNVKAVKKTYARYNSRLLDTTKNINIEPLSLITQPLLFSKSFCACVCVCVS